jgi:CheY-like chemotaxis protein
MIPSKRILVVDDEPVNQKLIENLLEVMGHSPEFANNGFEALEKIKSGFDLVLLDIRMPGIDGIEVVRRIRGNPESADIPIIMITVLDDKETHIQAIQVGANDFINKPIDRLELQIRMESLLKMREAQNAIKLHLDELEKIVAERSAKLIESNELLKSELVERKHAVCDNVPDLLWAKDLEGNAIFVNKAVLFKLKNSANSDRSL